MSYEQVNKNNVNVWIDSRGRYNIYDYINDFELRCPMDKIGDILEAMEHYRGYKESHAFRFLSQCYNDNVLNERYYADDCWSNNIQTDRIPTIIEMIKEFLEINGIKKETIDEILNELNNYSINKLLRVVRRIDEKKKGETNHD